MGLIYNIRFFQIFLLKNVLQKSSRWRKILKKFLIDAYVSFKIDYFVIFLIENFFRSLLSFLCNICNDQKTSLTNKKTRRLLESSLISMLFLQLTKILQIFKFSWNISGEVYKEQNSIKYFYSHMKSPKSRKKSVYVIFPMVNKY